MQQSKFTSLVVIVLASACFSSCSSSQWMKNKTEQSQPPFELKVATAVPVISSMAKELVEGTPISITYLPPAYYSIKRIPAWLKRQSIDSFPMVDVVAGISSVWPLLKTYPILRAHNIGVIPIDIAHAYVPGGERVAITPPSSNTAGDTSSYFWLNPANALVMLGILQRDLLSIIQQSSATQHEKHAIAQQLSNNFGDITQSLRALQLELDELLISQGLMQVAVSTPELRELAAASLLPQYPLEEVLTSDFPTLLITNKKNGHRSLLELPPHIYVWHVDDFSKDKGPEFTLRWKAMVNSLSPSNKPSRDI